MEILAKEHPVAKGVALFPEAVTEKGLILILVEP